MRCTYPQRRFGPPAAPVTALKGAYWEYAGGIRGVNPPLLPPLFAVIVAAKCRRLMVKGGGKRGGNTPPLYPLVCSLIAPTACTGIYDTMPTGYR